ncbi:TIGR03435 family protein [Terriglobus sp. RCC_193]|uniref:TIGR03435 family protein n=1 Tax=Terriglobus sp. RCC_193 TaxID=3239218 RepID=UPI0035237E2D
MLLSATRVAAAQDTPQFDAITVRPHDKNDPSQDGGIHWAGLVFEAKNVPLTFLMVQAFGVKKWLIAGLPAWAEKTTWDVNAKVSEGDLKLMQNMTREQRSRMLQAVLAEQFQLRYHYELRVEPVYELAVLPGGPKFKPTPSVAHGSGWTFTQGLVKVEAITMAQFVNGLSPLVERVVVDKTSLAGMYDMELHWTPEASSASNTDNGLPEAATPGIYTALREQLGVKLTSAKAPVPVLVVDKMEQPEAN